MQPASIRFFKKTDLCNMSKRDYYRMNSRNIKPFRKHGGMEAAQLNGNFANSTLFTCSSCPRVATLLPKSREVAICLAQCNQSTGNLQCAKDRHTGPIAKPGRRWKLGKMPPMWGLNFLSLLYANCTNKDSFCIVDKCSPHD